MNKVAIFGAVMAAIGSLAAVGSLAIEGNWFSSTKSASEAQAISTTGDNSPVVIGAEGDVTITDSSRD